MAHYRVVHTQAVWETAVVGVEVPSDIEPEDHEMWIKDNFGYLLDKALKNGMATIVQGDSVEGIDSEFVIEEAK